MPDAKQQVRTLLNCGKCRRMVLLPTPLALVLGSLSLVLTLPRLTGTARASSVAVTGGSGATLPYVERKIQQAATTGSMRGPDFTLGSLASDAVDRQAALLTGGQYVQFTLTQPAGSLLVTAPPYNADPTGRVDATTATQQAVNDASAQGKTVWLPSGNGNSVTNNLVTGSQYRGGGIMIDYEDLGNATAPFVGTTTVSNDTIQQTAGIGDQGIQQVWHADVLGR
ncbi:hypothetical protein [Thermogemmatispora sp.]|uniref:hypothetical protein n=1 Tax=Thermogemmatispora sp. TaxID=1968838 RepID=UPI001E126C79|nr:hypothetical protein [Thermogemmatispora sp.]MBX5450880.1 hypothetical protein [Thermogemmatispora sp.]